MRLFWNADVATFRRHAQSRVAIRNARARWSSPQAASWHSRMVDLFRTYPQVDPQTNLALAKSGHDGSSEVAKRAAVQAAGKKSRSLWDKVGDVVSAPQRAAHAAASAVGEAGAAAVGAVGEAVTPFLQKAPVMGAATGEDVKNTLRGGFTGLDVGVREFLGGIRAAGHAGVTAKERVGGISGIMGDPADFFGEFVQQFPDSISKSGASAGRIAIRDLIQGKPEGAEGPRVDLGSGFFPGGRALAEERQQAEVLRIDDMPISTGRVAANQFYEPGSLGFNLMSGAIDASVWLAADPAEIGLRVAGQANRARKSFVDVADRGIRARAAERLAHPIRKARDEAGLIEDATRQTLLPEKAEQWLTTSKQAGRLKEWVAEADLYDVWNGLFRGRHDLPAEMLLDFADAADVGTVDDAFRRWITEAAITERPSLNRANLAMKANSSSTFSRMAGSVPHSDLQWRSPLVAMETLDRASRNARMPIDMVRRNVENFARASASGSRPAVYEATSGWYDDLADHLSTEFGVKDRETMRRLTRMFPDDVEDARLYAIQEEIATGEVVPGLMTSPKDAHEITGPHFWTQYMNENIPLPDVREMRRVASEVSVVMNSGIKKIPEAYMDFALQKVWKPFKLISGGWVAKIVGEEQFRIAASGMDSMFSPHPFSAMLWASWKRGAGDIKGARFDTPAAAATDFHHFSEALSTRTVGTGWLDEQFSQFIRTKHKARLQRHEVGYLGAWSENVAMLHQDPIVHRIFTHGVDDAEDWFINGKGAAFRNQLLDETKNAKLATDQGARAFIRHQAKLAEEMTSANPELAEAIRTGKLRGAPIIDDTRNTTKAFREYLDEMIDDVGPDEVVGDLLTTKGRDGLPEVFERYDKAVTKIFAALMGKTTDYLSRSSTFRQSYWRKVRDSLPHMDAETQARVLEEARRQKLSGEDLRQMRKNIERHGAAPPGKGVNFDQMDQVAKGHALDTTKELLYDLHDRKQFWDMTRLIFPFGEAWQEVLTRWAKLAKDQPQVARRFQQGLHALRGGDQDDQTGIFTTDPRTGEEVVIFPFSQQLNERLIGVPIPMVGRVQGLSILGDVTPGVGPSLQVPVALLVPETPDWEDFRNFMNPFGEPDLAEGVLEEIFAPPWWGNMEMAFGGLRSAEQQRLFDNVTGDLANYLVSTGEYQIIGPNAEEEMIRLEKDAISAAKKVYFFRGMARLGGAPVTPSPRFMAVDKDGRLLMQSKVLDEFHKMVSDDPRNATRRFLEKYGTNMYLLMQGKSDGLFPATDAIDDFAQANPDLAKKYAKTYGLFFFAEGERDYTSYIRQIRRGERDPLNLNDRIAQANHRLAMMLYNEDRKRAGDTDEGRAWLRQRRAEYVDQFPGFMESPFNPRHTEEHIVPELRKALREPEFANTGAGRGAAIYFQARDEAMQEATERGLASFTTAKSARDLRDWLRRVAGAVMDDHPDFVPLWEHVFEREMTFEEEE